MKLTTSNEKQFYKPYINDIYIIHIYLHSKHLYNLCPNYRAQHFVYK